ncbi:MAG: T9SS type A sorting domain-containing protein [Melioribacteraceae bacterium]|nr:T9SS type A sorting domain-containing protein [Melioribacteraceae bacterium]
MKKIITKHTIFTALFLILPFNILAQFQSGSSMNQARMSHYQVLLNNGEIWVVGGHGTGFKALNTSELFDINTEQFTLQNMNYFHDSGALIEMNDEKFLIAGGAENLGIAPGFNTAEIYDPVAKTFTSTGAMNYPRTNCYGVTLASGKVLIAGGWYNNNSLAHAELYDHISGTFTSAPTLVTPRANPMIFPTSDGGAVVFGGYEGFSANPFYQSVEYYNAVADSFRILSNSILPDEEGYYIASIKNITNAFKTNENNYVFGVYRETETIKEYVFLSFDPINKTFSSLNRETVTENDQFNLIGSVLNKNDNILFTVWQLPTTPRKVGVGFLDLNTNQMSMPSEWFELPENYYPGYTGLTMLNSNSIMMSGGFSSPGGNTNFSPVDNTMIIDLTATEITTEKNTPDNFALKQNYPNPFNPVTTIEYSVPSLSASHDLPIQLKVYDVLGNELITLVNEVKHSGIHLVNFDGSKYASGVYYYKISSGNFIQTKKMILMK